MKITGRQENSSAEGKGQEEKGHPLLIPPRGPRRAETTGMNHSTNADHLLFYTSSSKIVSSITICSQNAFISSSAQKSLRGTASPFICHITHHSPFQYRQHIVGSFHDCSPVTTCSCLSPLPQLCCHNTSSCNNIGRTLVLFPNFQITIVFGLQIILVQIPPFWINIPLPNYHIN